jgi:hypothetical protein
MPLPSAYPGGQCDVLLRADDIVHDDHAPVQAQILRKAFRGSEFLYTLRLDSGHNVMAHVPSHHDHAVGSRGHPSGHGPCGDLPTRGTAQPGALSAAHCVEGC